MINFCVQALFYVILKLRTLKQQTNQKKKGKERIKK